MIDSSDAIQVIAAPGNKARIIWTASILLDRLKVAYYPNIPKHEYESAKAVLAQLCDDGYLVKRPELHTRYTLHESAYMRPDDALGRNTGPTAQSQDDD